MKKIAVYLAEGFEEIEATTIIDVLRRAAFDVTTVSVTGRLEVKGSHNITVIADSLFLNVDHKLMDMIVLPGGMPGSDNLKNHAGLQDVIKDFSKKNKMLGAICAAPLVFGSAGILQNKKATCYPGFENQLNGAIYTGANVEIAGNIVTGKGAGVALEFSLKIVELIKGKAFAEDLAKKMIA